MKFRKYYKSVIEKFNSNLFFQNIAIIASGSIMARIIGLFTAPIITRLYTPEDYGVLSVFTSMVGIIGSLSTLRYSVTIPLPDKDEIANNLLRLSFLITIILSFFWTFVIIVFGDFFALKFSIQHASQYLWVLPITFFGMGIYQALSSWATRHKYFKKITQTNLTQSVSSRAIKIVLGAFGIRPLGLLIGLIATQAAGIGSLLRKLLKENSDFFKYFSWKEIKYAAIRYKRFPIYQSWSQLLLSFGANLPVMLIASFYGTKVAGLYGLAHSMVSMPMGILGNAVSQVYYAEIAKYGKSNPMKIYKLSISIMKKLFFIALIPAIVLIIGGPWLFSLVFGENWYDAGIYARILSIIIMARFVVSPIMHCLNVLEKQMAQLFLNVLRLLLIIMVFTLSHSFKISAFNTIGSYSILLTLYYIFMMIFTLSLLRKEKDFRYFGNLQKK